MYSIKNKKIYYSNNNCTPFVRNILKSVFLVDDIKLTFLKGKRGFMVLRKKERTFEELIDKISGSDFAEQILRNNALMNELGNLVKNKEQVENSIFVIMKYLYSDEEECKNNDIIKKWIQLYGEKESFKFKRSADVNLVNYNETSTYLKLFKVQKESMRHMENATATLLETIPCDVDTIADIGAGPGLVNQYIPYYYDVLAVDINQEILNQNRRKTCIGDILDIPLQNQSVDMTIACDVMEHIEVDKLDKAVAELRRVSRKYIYIQVPHNEILRYGVAKCSECGNIWHVNFHKNSFTLEALRQFENAEWVISQVNYTGNVDNEIESSRIYEQIERDGLDIYRVENFECPKCGAKSKPIHLDILEEMMKNENRQKESKKIIPKYSEIAVLFEKRCKRKSIKADKYCHFPEQKLFSNIEIDFSKRFMSKSTYTGKEQIPVFYSGSSEVKMTEEGFKISGKDNFWIGIALPYLIDGDEVELKGKCLESTQIIIAGIDGTEKEFMEEQGNLDEGNFSYNHKMSSKWNEHSTFLKYYFNKEIMLHSLQVHRMDEKKYYLIEQSDTKQNHIVLNQKKVLYRYYIPEQGVAFEQKKNEAIEVE